MINAKIASTRVDYRWNLFKHLSKIKNNLISLFMLLSEQGKVSSGPFIQTEDLVHNVEDHIFTSISAVNQTIGRQVSWKRASRLIDFPKPIIASFLQAFLMLPQHSLTSRLDVHFRHFKCDFSRSAVKNLNAYINNLTFWHITSNLKLAMTVDLQ